MRGPAAGSRLPFRGPVSFLIVKRHLRLSPSTKKSVIVDLSTPFVSSSFSFDFCFMFCCASTQAVTSSSNLGNGTSEACTRPHTPESPNETQIDSDEEYTDSYVGCCIADCGLVEYLTVHKLGPCACKTYYRCTAPYCEQWSTLAFPLTSQEILAWSQNPEFANIAILASGDCPCGIGPEVAAMSNELSGLSCVVEEKQSRPTPECDSPCPDIEECHPPIPPFRSSVNSTWCRCSIPSPEKQRDSHDQYRCNHCGKLVRALNGNIDGYLEYLQENAGWRQRAINGNTSHTSAALASRMMPHTVAQLALATNPDGKLGDNRGVRVGGEPALAHVPNDLIPLPSSKVPLRSISRPLIYDAGTVIIQPGETLFACMAPVTPGPARYNPSNDIAPNNTIGLTYSICDYDGSLWTEFVEPLSSNQAANYCGPATSINGNNSCVPWSNPYFNRAAYNTMLTTIGTIRGQHVTAINPGFPSAVDYEKTFIQGGYLRFQAMFSNSLDSCNINAALLQSGKLTDSGVRCTTSGSQAIPIDDWTDVADEMTHAARMLSSWNTSDEFHTPPFVVNGDSASAATTQFLAPVDHWTTSDNPGNNVSVPTSVWHRFHQWAAGTASDPYSLFQELLYPNEETCYITKQLTATMDPEKRGIKVRFASGDLQYSEYGQTGCKAFNINNSSDGQQVPDKLRICSTASAESAMTPRGVPVICMKNTTDNVITGRLSGVLYLNVAFPPGSMFGHMCPIYDEMHITATIVAGHAPFFTDPNSFKTFFKSAGKWMKEAAGAAADIAIDVGIPAALDAIVPGSGEFVGPIAVIGAQALKNRLVNRRDLRQTKQAAPKPPVQRPIPAPRSQVSLRPTPAPRSQISLRPTPAPRRRVVPPQRKIVARSRASRTRGPRRLNRPKTARRRNNR